jgi:septal ring factor EnvC (AmiA/AmiB activator)
MEYLTRALATSHEHLVHETSKTAQKVEVLEDRTNKQKNMIDYIRNDIVACVNRDDSLELTMDTMRATIERMQHRIDQLEQAPSVAKRRRRVTICAS